MVTTILVSASVWVTSACGLLGALAPRRLRTTSRAMSMFKNDTTETIYKQLFTQMILLDLSQTILYSNLSQIILFNSELHENETPPNIHLDLETCSRDTATLDICLFLVSNTSFHPACIPNHTDNIAVSLSIVDLECLAQKKTPDSTPACVPLESDNKCFP